MSPLATHEPGSLRLWFSRLSDSTGDAERAVQAVMSDSERARLDAICNPRRRREYLLSRALMRHALCDSFGGSPASWHFDEIAGAPPRIDNLPEGVHYALSHSKHCIVYAIFTSPIGIDIEIMHPRRDFARLAEGFMNHDEQACMPLEASARIAYFYRLWCAKEAAYKRLPPAEQAAAALAGITFRELLSKRDCGFLLEAQAAGYGFAALTRTLPDSIDCRHFHCVPGPLSRALERRPIPSAAQSESLR